MLLTKESVFPYGKYKNINILLVMNSMFGVNYIKWWDKKVTAHPFNDEIKSILSTKIKELQLLQDEYEREESLRDKSEDDPQPTKTNRRRWDLPDDSKPLEYYLYR